jgi:hypothetical protein
MAQGCQPYEPTALPRNIFLFLVLNSVRGWVNSRTQYSQRNQVNWKNSSGLKPETFQLVAYCLNHYNTECPHLTIVLNKLCRLQQDKHFTLLWNKQLHTATWSSTSKTYFQTFHQAILLLTSTSSPHDFGKNQDSTASTATGWAGVLESQ